MKIKLEVCVASLKDAVVAANSGAARIELNAAIELGGLTPSFALTELVVEAAQPRGCGVIAMVRPRPGGFAYDDDELRVMRRNIELMLKLGVDGVAFGVLREGGTVAASACRSLIEPVLDAGREAVFHRAFDLTPDPQAALDRLVSIGFKRVLTSGGKPTALEGADTIKQLRAHAAKRIDILPGCGIRPENVQELVQRTGCTQVHASLRKLQPDTSSAANPSLSFNADGVPASAYGATDPAAVSAMMKVLAGL